MIAEIHNKISNTYSNLTEKLEDQLTGNVFGSLRYLPLEIGLIPLINECYSDNLDEINKFINDSNKTDYKFWYKSSKYGEIDLIIEFFKKEELCGVIGIEVKYLSSISSDQDEFCGDDKEQDKKCIHQLWRYMKLLNETYPKIPKAIIYLTNSYDDSKNHIDKAIYLDEGKSHIFTMRLTWSKVHHVIYKEKLKNPLFPYNIIISDIENLLRHKNLDSFMPLEIVKNPRITYLFDKHKYQYNFNYKKTFVSYSTIK